MNNYFKIIGLLIAGVVIGLLLTAVVNRGDGKLAGGDYHQTTEYFYEGLKSGRNDEVFLSGDGSASLGTTTIARSSDGFVLYGAFTVSTTTPTRVALTNTGAPLICDGESLNVYADATTFAPSFQFVMGTTTSATLYADNLLASTTIATTTDSVKSLVTGWNFFLQNNNSITLSVGDITNVQASSTFYGNWAGHLSVHCWTVGS